MVKQADLVLAMHWRGDAFTAEQKARNFAYYERRTVRDSSLSACTQAVIAAEVGHLELAHDYLGEAALMDLHDLHDNTRDGLHIASLAGAWLALVAGFGGMRDHDGELSFAPRLPGRINRLEFSLLWRGLRLRVDVRSNEVTYSLRNGGRGRPGRAAPPRRRRRGDVRRRRSPCRSRRCSRRARSRASPPAGPRCGACPPHRRRPTRPDYNTDRCTWFVWSLDGSPLAEPYDFQPVAGSQICRYQIT